MTTITLHPVGATFTPEAHPNRTPTHAARDRMRISGQTGGKSYVYLRYNVEVPDDHQLTQATHRLVGEGTLGTARSVRVFRTDYAPNFGDVSWNNPLATVGTSVSVSDTKRWDHDVTDLIPAAGGSVVLRFDTTDSADWWVNGRRDARGFPRLTYVVEPRPVQPTDVKPAGNIGIAAPYFTWHGQVDVDTVRVQVAAVDADWDAVTGFTAPVWDSGEVASTENGLDSAAAGWTGLADTEAVDVTVWEATPLGPGGWSEPITITRVDKPTITFTNPGATTADATPAVMWTAPGQVAWQVLIDNSDEGRVANSGKQPGEDGGAYQQPDSGGDPDESFTYTVRAWDDVDRSPSLGDPTYAEAVLTSVYTPTATVAPITGLTVRQVPGMPKVVLEATRAAGLPDQVRSIRNGVVARVQEAVDGLTWDDWGCPPNQPVTYRARAVVNNEDADTDAIATIQTVVKGVWVVDPITERGFVLADKDGLDVALGGNVAVHTPIAGAHLIRRTMALRGIEGTIRGRIADAWPGKTLRQQYEDALWLRERPERPLQLIMGDLNVTVVTSNLQPLFDAQTSFAKDIRHNVSFDLSDAPKVS